MDKDVEGMHRALDKLSGRVEEATMSDKATPRPWTTEESGELLSIITADGCEVTTIGALTLGDLTETDRANAELIIRAVNNHDALVEALGAITDVVQTWVETSAENCPIQSIFTEVMAKARAALKAAKGE